MIPRRPRPYGPYGHPREPMELAKAYVPFQRYERVWEPAEGLAKGTIFPELYDPYRVPYHTREEDK